MVVADEVVRRDIDRAAICAVVQVEARELHHARVAAVQTDVALLDGLFVDLEIDLDVIGRRVAEVADVHREIVEILLAEHDTAGFDVGDRDVWLRNIGPQVDRGELCSV